MIVSHSDIRIVIGAGEFMNNPGWIHTQESELDLLNPDTWKDRFQPNSITALLAEHVWEHLSFEEGIAAAKLCYDYLKPSGYFRCAVPDGFFRNDEYQRIVQIGGPGPKDHPAASHKIVYNYQTLSNMFEAAGFEVRLLEYCDEEGKFHHTDWNEQDGVIFRSKKIDSRNQEKLSFPSLIIDAIKKV
ncbi:class I SAM-dependent methyltransferase [Fictibacillus arsenicus]|uniref:Protein distantly related to SAM-dependent methyltransferase n=1 Tax=Fictibacillus arsenicus TaxID=255247 RepID=A0A1V3G7W1_9BACL|nr:SAM-dependent methyltransferase [Fictibacillus arsenicus]OOE12465.1 protein distantly related to SAM-dependent methyltransferase [Fictibacillus arsenicus]